ncbi:XdhC family protein [Aquimarina sp. U1-2]|uniref:XdhC family protein n=1 Tax=Aquimarina sp. U1-2 TaxID=2823141 RepID=UPI001FEFF125|nr:XdhC/CoxI family protein [Aquimarina sp. U1-2]
MSAVACIKEGHMGSTEEIKEYMSGNICRCDSGLIKGNHFANADENQHNMAFITYFRFKKKPMREIDRVLHKAYMWKEPKVLATIIRTEGSSYRKAGAAMLISEGGKTEGGVSGGCIEKEVRRQSFNVFKDKKPVLIEYDGRYQLGCNGTIYILLEPFTISNDAVFWEYYFQAFQKRESFKIFSMYAENAKGSVFNFNDQHWVGLSKETETCVSSFLNSQSNLNEDINKFLRQVKPRKQLFVFGGEVDAHRLAEMALMVGYDVTMVSHIQNPIIGLALEGIRVINCIPEQLLKTTNIDENAAVVLMSHSYSRDLAFLVQLIKLKGLRYLGLLGPANRRNSLINDLLELSFEPPFWFEDIVFGPAGLDIGGELPAEVALSIISEIQAVFNSREGMSFMKISKSAVLNNE